MSKARPGLQWHALISSKLPVVTEVCKFGHFSTRERQWHAPHASESRVRSIFASIYHSPVIDLKVTWISFANYANYTIV